MATFDPSLEQTLGQENFQALQNDIANSPFLQSLLNNFAGTISVGSPGAGTSSQGSNIVLDPEMLTAAGTTPDDIALALAHELGHEDLPFGTPAPASGVQDAVSKGEQAEGAAITAEAIVADQLGVADTVDINSTTLLSLVANEYGVDPAQINSVNQLLDSGGGQFYRDAVTSQASQDGQFTPSVAQNLTYDQYYADQYILSHDAPAEIASSQIDWQRVQPGEMQETSNGGVALSNLPLADGGTVSYSKSTTDGTTTTAYHNADGTAVTATDDGTKTETTTYNASGRAVNDSIEGDQNGAAPNVSAVTNNTYGSDGSLTQSSSTSSDGATTTASVVNYYSNGQVSSSDVSTTVTGVGTTTVHSQYDSSGALQQYQVSNPDGSQYSAAYTDGSFSSTLTHPGGAESDTYTGSDGSSGDSGTDGAGNSFWETMDAQGNYIYSWQSISGGSGFDYAYADGSRGFDVVQPDGSYHRIDYNTTWEQQPVDVLDTTYDASSGVASESWYGPGFQGFETADVAGNAYEHENMWASWGTDDHSYWQGADGHGGESDSYTYTDGREPLTQGRTW
jgi:hypothetical protein